MSDMAKAQFVAEKLSRLELSEDDPAYSAVMKYGCGGIKTYSDYRAFYAGYNARNDEVTALKDRIAELETQAAVTNDMMRDFSNRFFRQSKARKALEK